MSGFLYGLTEVIGVLLGLTGLWARDYAFAACGYALACWAHLARTEKRA